MKEVYVIRHADWDFENDSLTESGIKKCLELKKRLPKFDVIISSDFDRNKETAKLLFDSEFKVYNRAGILRWNDEQEERVAKLRKTHPLGVVGALFSIPELIGPLKEAGNRLLSLIKDIISELPDEGKAAIISHDGTMVACEKLINYEPFDKAEKTYDELQGYIIDDNRQLRSL